MAVPVMEAWTQRGLVSMLTACCSLGQQTRPLPAPRRVEIRNL